MQPKKNTRIRKEEIVQATLRVVAERGSSGVTIAAIAEAAGMSEANIYRHFSGKEGILHAVADFIGANLMARAATLAAGSGSPAAKLKAVFFNHISMLAENPGMPRFIFSEEVHLRDRALAQAMAVRMGSYVESIAGIIAAGVEEGDFREGLSPRETAMTLLGMISFTALRWSISNYAFDVTRDAEGMWENFLILAARCG